MIRGLWPRFGDHTKLDTVTIDETTGSIDQRGGELPPALDRQRMMYTVCIDGSAQNRKQDEGGRG